MRFPHHARVVALIAMSAHVAACSPESVVAPQAQPADLDQLLGQLDLPYFTVGAFATLSVEQAKLVPSACAYETTSSEFVCPSLTVGNLTVTRSFALSSAAATQPQFEPATTSDIAMRAHAAGTDTSGGVIFVTDAVANLRLTGLLTNSHVLNGGMVSRTTVVKGNESTPSGLVSTSTRMMRSITFSTSSPWPTSGTIDIDLLTEGARFSPGSVHMQVVFNGTSKAQWITTSNAPTQHCTIDLTAQSEAVCSQ